MAIVPSKTLGRSIEESMSSLPQELGGSSISTITDGLRWVSLALVSETRPVIRADVQATGPDATKALLKLVQDGLHLLAKASQNDPAMTSLATSISRMKPVASSWL